MGLVSRHHSGFSASRDFVMLTRSQQDASFYGAMHALLAGASADGGERDIPVAERELSPLTPIAMNRRTMDRRPFSCPQLMAPYDGKDLPSQSKFRLTECYDISTTGFGFLADQIPDSQFVVIALGTVPFSFFSAEIVHVDRLEVSAASKFQVGCRFLQRLNSLSSE
jgi:hypothetical protein